MKVDLDFYGQNMGLGPIDKILYDRYFRDRSTGFFIEAGAYDGLYLSSCKFFEDQGWSGINIEPTPEVFKQLMINRSKSCNINAALAEIDGEVPLQVYNDKNGVYNHVVTDRHGVRIIKTEDYQRFLFENTEFISIDEYKTRHTDKEVLIYVPSISYSTLINRHKISHIDLFVLDIENLEKEFLESMIDHEVIPDIFCIEHFSTGLSHLKDILSKRYKFDWNDILNAVFIKI